MPMAGHCFLETCIRRRCRRGDGDMNMTEVARLLLGLRAAGWTEKEINDFVLYIESGEEQYKPKPKAEREKQMTAD